MLISGILSILTISATSKTPFKSHPITHAFTLWAFVGSFALLILSFAGASNTLANDHNARVSALLCGLAQSLGIAFVFAGFVTGISASSRPMDDE